MKESRRSLAAEAPGVRPSGRDGERPTWFAKAAWDLAKEPVTIMCRHGERKDDLRQPWRAGGRPAVFVGGTRDWSGAVERPPATGA